MTFAFNIHNGLNRFNKVVIFGDSLSDTGNVYKLTNGEWPIFPPYYQGRFCNGPNWVDRIKVIDKSNYAYGGATTDNNFVQGYTNLNTVPVPGVRQQIAIYLNKTNKKSIAFKRALYIIWAGGNDFIFNNTVTPTQIVNNLINTIQILLAAGAKHFLIFNQAPTQAFPYISRLNQNAFFTALTLLANNAFQTSLNATQQNNKKASIHMFDIHALMTKVIANTSTITFTNTVDKCCHSINSASVVMCCQDPTEYVFLDSFHLTTTVHQLIADAVDSFLSFRFRENTPGCYIRSF